MKSALNQQFFDELAIELRDYVLPAESELIRQELELHIEERRVQLLEMGLSEAEAEAAAIAALGTPAEIARPYASLHYPGRRYNLSGAFIGALASLCIYSMFAGSANTALLLAASLALMGSAIWLAIRGAKHGYALTFGRLLNFGAWATLMGIVSLLVPHLPSESKVAVSIPASTPPVETRVYKAPDNKYLLAISEGPLKGTAYLVFTREPAPVGTPTLPVEYLSSYFKQSGYAYASIDSALQNEFRQTARLMITVTFLGVFVCALACGIAFLLQWRLRRNQPSKSPPLSSA